MSDQKFRPYVPAESNMKEFTLRALLLGLVMAVVLGAANAYLGLKAGMTIAATYPAAVIGMAVLKLMKGTILEENFARTVGSIGESVAAGAIFTIPAFLIAGVWTDFFTFKNYMIATAIMFVGGIVGILFVSILRRVMVEDKDLPFPESVAAAEIHKAGRSGKSGAKYLFWAMGLGALVQILKQVQFFATSWEKFVHFSLGKLGLGKDIVQTGGGAVLSTPGVSPAYMGVGYIIGPNLSALNFTGGLLAWGLFVPALLFFLGPQINVQERVHDKIFSENLSARVELTVQSQNPAYTQAEIDKKTKESVSVLLTNLDKKQMTPEQQAIYDEVVMKTGAFMETANAKTDPAIVAEYSSLEEESWIDAGNDVWRGIVRKIAIGGMLMSAAYTLYKMRKNLSKGLGRAVSDVRKSTKGSKVQEARTDKDMNFKWVFIGILLAAVATFVIYYYFCQDFTGALVATIVMIVAGFFFSAVSGNLVGLIGSSNNPISGLTISTLLIAALLMVALGVKGMSGVAAVLGVAAVICVAAAVAGEMLQDLKVGHILGGTPWKMQIGDMFGILVSASVMFFPLLILHQGDINMGGTGLGGKAYPAPQASLMAILAKGIVAGDMAWPLIIVGILMAVGLILVKVKSPMLVCVGMYLPLETSFAIFIGGLIKGIVDKFAEKRKLNDAQKARTENNGVLLASGLIAGEALIGLLFALFAVLEWRTPVIFKHPSFLVSLLVFVVVGYVLVKIPLKNAGKADEPAPPSAVM
ncbi:MAG: oligopeptide transporter, OPT family [Candidatus Marinimicrobia bacterium]|nr:oligopeptide transporter, OPT family [Candidatus Neomarinimicrobiota bacterium]